MAASAAHPDGSAGPSPSEQSLARGLLLTVAAGYLAVQLALFSIDRAPRWDEAVYLSQVTPGLDAQFFAPFRARGLPLLIAPITWLGGSITAVRIVLAVVASLALAGSFWVWIPVVGIAGPLAAMLFGFSWMGLLNGSEIFPNFLAATLGLGVAGYAYRQLIDGGRWPVVISATLMAVLALFRPTEATAVFAAVGIYVVIFHRSAWRVLLPIGLGLALGWLPWVVEMSIRFGGPLNALDEAGSAPFVLSAVAANFRQYLAYTDGRIFSSQAEQIPLAGVFWWSWLGVMAFVGITYTRKETGRPAAQLCSVGAVVLATLYVIVLQDRALAPRYLLPAMVFVSVPAAVGTVSLFKGGARTRVVGLLALILVIPWGIWQAGVADRVEAREARHRESFRVVGLTLRQLADNEPCTFISLRGAAEIALASGCRGTQVLDPGPTDEELGELSRTSDPAFLVLSRTRPPPSAVNAVTPIQVAEPGQKWLIYQLRDPPLQLARI